MYKLDVVIVVVLQMDLSLQTGKRFCDHVILIVFCSLKVEPAGMLPHQETRNESFIPDIISLRES